MTTLTEAGVEAAALAPLESGGHYRNPTWDAIIAPMGYGA